ncbi:MAG: hypothetical protein D6828_03550, partial [Nitrospirae bacterium]
EAAIDTGLFDTIFVTTDDERVSEYCSKFDGVITYIRPRELSSPRVKLSQVLYDGVVKLESHYEIFPDIIVLLSVHSPLRGPEHICKAVDTLILYNTDSVISVYEDYELHFTHGKNGLKALNRGMLNKIRLERESLYVDNGAIKVFWRDVIKEDELYGRNIGHIVMAFDDSLQIKKPFDLWMAEQILLRRKRQMVTEQTLVYSEEV